jgi:symplekin
MTPKLRVMIKSMEKTTRMLLIHVNKRYDSGYPYHRKSLTARRDPHNPQALRIHQHVERLMRSRTEIFDDVNRKRGLAEPIDGLDPAKRQRLGANAFSTPPNHLHIPPLAPGPRTVAELFTLNVDESVKGFDVSQMPEDLVVKIGISILSRVDAGTFNQAINVRQHLLMFEA